MTKKNLPFIPQYFDRYVNLVDENLDYQQALTTFDGQWLTQFQNDFEKLGDQVYAPGKWTIKDILQHIIDTERVLAYRALSIGRGDKVALPSFDEETFAQNALVAGRTIEDLLEEFSIVRQSTVLMFKSISDEMLLNVGEASTKPITTLALALTITGHAIHHMNVVQERYFGLINS